MMKFNIIYIALLCSSLHGFAQSEKNEITDNLLNGKENVLANFVPMANNKYLYKMYVIPPPEMLERLESFEASYSSALEQEMDSQLRRLKKQDLNYFKRNVLYWYTGLYGMDSIGMGNMEKMLVEKKGDPKFSELYAEAQKKAYVKQLTADERKMLTDEANKDSDISNETLFKRSAAYRSWLDRYLKIIRRSKYHGENSSLGYYGEDLVMIDVVNREISNPFMKEYLNYALTTKFMKGGKYEKLIEEAYTKFMAMATNDHYKDEARAIYDNYKAMAPNSSAPGFNFENIEGNEISLMDLRGKYVYIDVWATWCGPCKAEIPFLKVMEKKFHGKDIHFVSISVDKMKDKQKWVKYVTENKLKGVQLMADKDFSSDFIKKFNINTIPRFILIDPAGKIVNHDAKRPSDAELTSQLEALLK